MEIKDYKEELIFLKKLVTSTDKNGNPVIVRNTTNHTMKINPRIDPATLISILNYLTLMCDPKDACMDITTTIFAAHAAFESDGVKDYNLFVKEAATIATKDTRFILYQKAKNNGKEIVLPDFTYFLGSISNQVDTSSMDLEDKKQYSKNFVNSIRECINQNEIKISKEVKIK